MLGGDGLIETVDKRLRFRPLVPFHEMLAVVPSRNHALTRPARTDDGVQLVDKALAGDIPLLAINALSSESERSEQRGFANLVRGIFGMFRNPTAHTARIHWMMNKKDAEDLLSVVSLIHRRLDNAQPSARA